MLFQSSAEKGAKQEKKQPGQQREIVGGIKALIQKTEGKQPARRNQGVLRPEPGDEEEREAYGGSGSAGKRSK